MVWPAITKEPILWFYHKQLWIKIAVWNITHTLRIFMCSKFSTNHPIIIELQNIFQSTDKTSKIINGTTIKCTYEVQSYWNYIDDFKRKRQRDKYRFWHESNKIEHNCYSLCVYMLHQRFWSKVFSRAYYTFLSWYIAYHFIVYIISCYIE